MASDKCDYEYMTRIPTGYRFIPTDFELIECYLSKKAKGEPFPCDIIPDCEIYGYKDKEPWKIFGETSSETFYVFTKLKKKGKGRRIDRIAGCGTWKGQRSDLVKDFENNHVGFRKLFVFEFKGSDGSDNGGKGHWLMHKFSLLNNDQSDYVVCAIRNKDGIVDDEPPSKRVRIIDSVEEDQVPSRVFAPTSTMSHLVLDPISDIDDMINFMSSNQYAIIDLLENENGEQVHQSVQTTQESV